MKSGNVGNAIRAGLVGIVLAMGCQKREVIPVPTTAPLSKALQLPERCTTIITTGYDRYNQLYIACHERRCTIGLYHLNQRKAPPEWIQIYAFEER